MKIRTHLSLAFGTLVAAVAGSVGFGIYHGERTHWARAMEAARQSSLNQFVQAARDAGLLGDDIGLLNATEIIARAPAAREAYILDEKNLTRAHSDVSRIGSQGHPLPPGLTTVDSAGEVFFHAVRSIPLGSDRVWTAVVRFSRTEADREIDNLIRHTWKIIAGVSTGVLAAGLLAAALLAYGITHPIERLRKGAQAVAQGHLDHRLGLRRRDELGDLGRAFDAMAVRLGELDRMKSDFVANVTHEVRSPLSAIEAAVSLMIDNLREGKTTGHLDLMMAIRNSAARLSRLISNILEVARIEERRCDVNPASIVLADLFSEVTSLFQEKAHQKNIDLGPNSVLPSVTLWADPDKLNLVLCNLVDNALKFTPPGGTIRLSCGEAGEDDPRIRRGRRRNLAKSGRYACLTVTDTGPGISMEDQERIFNRFEQAARPAKGPRGTGLGLTICRGWIEAHAGHIEVESAPNRGSAFHIFLPWGGVP